MFWTKADVLQLILFETGKLTVQDSRGSKPGPTGKQFQQGRSTIHYPKAFGRVKKKKTA